MSVMKDQVAIIVGAGPSGLSAAAALRHLSIPFLVLEREDCFASLWKNYAYDRLHLHLPKQFCELPHMPFPASYPRYVPKALFLDYLDSYVKKMEIEPLYRRLVESAEREDGGSWVVRARNLESGEVEEYRCKFLLVASGETTDPNIPGIEGMGGFPGKAIHSTEYKNGKEFEGKNVLVVGAGNSGMEIALDLANHGARCSIVVRSPVHILSREMVSLALLMLKHHVPLYIVDGLLAILSRVAYGDMSKHGIRRPDEGPFLMKVKYGKYPFIDVGTCGKIRSGEIQVMPAIKRVSGGVVEFVDDKSHPFDVIVFCTGFKRSTHKWLKGDDYMLNEDGLPKQGFPNHWKGKNGLYCVGLSRRGLYGAAGDALLIADDIHSQL
ncbi:hypothetical protein MLD38_033029 [Melastoma candidum]|uniref:Uncharacterized protein n=1 Tax=Melastoma candidum TaxID=119954 RepID=A0ACB9M5F8_9MYRT|nr:hypothetical protein MLD38_033029 [Melastoma candidum]